MTPHDQTSPDAAAASEPVHETDRAIATALAWAEADLDPETRAQAQNLIALVRSGNAEALTELRTAFGARLAFGTAGLRGPIGAGPARMNRVVVSQTSAGFAAYLLGRSRVLTGGNAPSIVIGYDARVNSEIFARDTAEIMAGAGVRVILLPEAGPTPLTAFAVRHLGTSAGVMITASHNPPQDNGYKVYLGDADGGSQIVPPADGEIAAHIDRLAAGPVADLPRSSQYAIAGPELLSAYVAETSAALLAGFPLAADGVATAAGSSLTIVYTAMHGVGSALAHRVFSSTGLPPVTVVPEQDAPDGAFPTVAFPNPEEPGALDLAFRTAREVSADLIVAHDPDADRLAIALPAPGTADGYRRLTGNELGLLLGWRAAERERVRAEAGERPAAGTLACTIVSSPALGAVAREYGLGYAETLSGFKWVSRVPQLLFGFEEALGYLTHPEIVRDKDGISASADAIAMARECAAEGRTLWDLLDDASARFGHFASGQVTLRLPSMAAATMLSERVRNAPPTSFAGIAVDRTLDLLTPGAAEVPANVLRFDLADGSRIMIRPSGTEPKLKVYIDTFSDAGTVPERRAAAEQTLASLETAVRQTLLDAQSEPGSGSGSGAGTESADASGASGGAAS
ncbi:phospho-sugar mutase [Leucobacter rhizosphaerae]|uniref:Phospho-sugar mutase n=1 Tax=Leucobacter rhizosphaerae TaxID=2932245 RepID=A0ABY4FU69_9MICO|nr:phospho-sugar mutase [Leucobacter rhizosphaerae]UOQ59817.1 phospho-sugar mutase [Leucobacter rhizosphaerae]